jgi:hypothetical protein
VSDPPTTSGDGDLPDAWRLMRELLEAQGYTWPTYREDYPSYAVPGIRVARGRFTSP